MTNELQTFTNEEFGKLDVLMIDNKPYFPATECAIILGYSKPRNAIERHCKGALKRGSLTNGGIQDKNYISEGDLYRLIIRSKLPAALKFEKWVFDEVLPAIRMQGMYITDETLEKVLSSPAFSSRLFETIKFERKKNAQMQEQIAQLSEKSRYCDTILASKEVIPVSVIAKDYGVSAAVFNRLLRDLKIQYKLRDTWLLYQKYAGYGYTVSRTYHINEYESVIHTYWTQRGRMFLYETLKGWGIVPLVELECQAV